MVSNTKYVSTFRIKINGELCLFVLSNLIVKSHNIKNKSKHAFILIDNV